MINFWENLLRYPKFFIVSLSGLVLTIISPFIYLFKNTTNKLIYIGLFILVVLFLYFSLSNMIEVI